MDEIVKTVSARTVGLLFQVVLAVGLDNGITGLLDMVCRHVQLDGYED